MRRYGECIFLKADKRRNKEIVKLIFVTRATHGFDGYLGVKSGHPDMHMPGIVFGKENSALQKMSQSIQYGLGAALGSGKQYMSWIHLHDMVAAYQFILEKDLKGVYNVVSPNPRTNKEITKSIAKVLSRPLWLPNVPSFVLNLLLGEMHEILLESQYVDSNLLEEKGFKFTYEYLEDALQGLC